MSFFTSLIGAKLNQLGQDIIAAVVDVDPETATLAQLDQMEKELDKAGLLIQKLRVDFEKETREATNAQKKYDQLLAAAGVLEGRLTSAENAAAQASIEASLTKLLADLELLKPEVDREQQDVVEVKSLLDSAEAAYRDKGEALAKARGGLDRARRDMERAKIEQGRAEERANRAAEVAGLRASTVSASNVATDAMQRRADEARAKAATATLKSDTLLKAVKPIEGDKNIADALRQVATGATPTESLQERLARLKR